MDVVIVGSGNIAQYLCEKCHLVGHNILQIVARNSQRGKFLAEICNSTYSANFESINRNANIYIISVSDGAIENVASNFKLVSGVVLHTAGAVSKDVLESCSNKFGVLYPLQSIVSSSLVKKDFPMLIDSNSDESLLQIKLFAQTLSNNILEANDEYRKNIHLAAVIANNFSNHLFTLTDQFCKAHNVSFELLFPLLEETVHRLKFEEPSIWQTGPAIRNDNNTISKHIEYLKDNKSLLNIYSTMTDSIQTFYKNKNNNL
jgi:predicted short-subunit dehydrogenase-like oxidoreductase (DUF2520 family)